MVMLTCCGRSTAAKSTSPPSGICDSRRNTISYSSTRQAALIKIKAQANSDAIGLFTGRKLGSAARALAELAIALSASPRSDGEVL